MTMRIKNSANQAQIKEHEVKKKKKKFFIISKFTNFFFLTSKKKSIVFHCMGKLGFERIRSEHYKSDKGSCRWNKTCHFGANFVGKRSQIHQKPKTSIPLL